MERELGTARESSRSYPVSPNRKKGRKSLGKINAPVSSRLRI